MLSWATQSNPGREGQALPRRPAGLAAWGTSMTGAFDELMDN